METVDQMQQMNFSEFCIKLKEHACEIVKSYDIHKVSKSQFDDQNIKKTCKLIEDFFNKTIKNPFSNNCIIYDDKVKPLFTNSGTFNYILDINDSRSENVLMIVHNTYVSIPFFVNDEKYMFLPIGRQLFDIKSRIFTIDPENNEMFLNSLEFAYDQSLIYNDNLQNKLAVTIENELSKLEKSCLKLKESMHLHQNNTNMDIKLIMTKINKGNTILLKELSKLLTFIKFYGHSIYGEDYDMKSKLDTISKVLKIRLQEASPIKKSYKYRPTRKCGKSTKKSQLKRKKS